MRRAAMAIAGAGMIVCPAAMPAAQLEATWNGGTGNWNVPGNWTPSVIPNNATDTYLVRIDGGKAANSIVSLNQLATVDGVNVDAGDSLLIANQQTLTIVTDSVTNNGTVEINNSGGGATRVQFTVPVTLQGSGDWVLSNSAQNRFGPFGGLTTLNALGTIRGAGTIEMGANLFANQGTIRQEGTIALIVANGAGGFGNPGLLEAAGAGGLTLQGGLFTNTGGEISALDESFVQIGPSATILGGELSTAGTGQIRAFGSGATTPLLDGVLINNSFLQPNLQFTRIRGTIVNNGIWTMNHLGGATTDLLPEQNASMSGSGELVMGTNANVRIFMDTTSFTNNTNHTIRGVGQILANGGEFVNKGVIRHTGGNSLTISTGAGSVTNESIIESTAGEGLNVLVLRDGTFDSSASAVIRAVDTGIVQLGPTATISGGILETEESGILRINSSSAISGAQVPILKDLVINGAVVQPNVNSAIIRGTITNNGLWTSNHASGSTSNVIAQNGAVLQGIGSIFMNGNANGRFLTDDSIITHESGHTIRGAGVVLVADGGTLHNKGLIRQETDTSLTVSTGTGNLINESTMEAAGAGRLIITNAQIENEGGLIRALDTRAAQIGPMATVRNGTLRGVNTGRIEFNSSSSISGPNVPILEDLVLEGLVVQPNVTSVILRGTITNNSLWTSNHVSSSSSDIILQNGVVLAGTGTISMNGNTFARFMADASVTTHESGHSIRGAGQVVVADGGTLINRGLIRQESGTSLTVRTGTGEVTNESIMEAAGGGRLILSAAEIENDGGLIRALDTYVAQIGPAAIVRNGTLRGVETGRIELSSSGSTSGANVPILEDVILEGLVVQPNITSAAIRGTVTNNALWTLNHISGSSSNVIALEGAVLSGTGTLSMSGNTNNRIVSEGTTLIHEAGHTIRGVGQIMAGTGGFINRGTVRADGVSLTLSANEDGFLNEGNLVAAPASSLIIASGANFINEGDTLVEATGNLTVTTGNYVQTGGETQVNGTMALTQVGASAQINGGVLSGDGSISRNVVNSGFVSPGTSAGILTIGQAYTQTAAGTLVTELGGTTPVEDHDVLGVVGNATIDGRLHVELIGDLSPSVGQEFTILTALGVTGEFDVVSGALEADGIVLEPIYLPTQVRLLAVGLDGIAVNDVTVEEGVFGTTDAVFTVSLSEPNNAQTVQVTVATEDGTATAGSDYIALPPTVVSFAPGETSKQVTVKVLNDGAAESEEYFKLVLSNEVNAPLARPYGVGIIADSPEIPREDWMIVY